MDAATLHKLTDHITLERCHELIPGLYVGFRLADLDTAKRRAMFFSQVLEESVGLSATTEFASGSEYEGRADLGNTHPGDGVKYKGRGFIQLTGRSNYGNFSRWCHARGLVANDHWFLDHPEQVANDEFAWLSAAWYWLNPHPHDGLSTLNQAADAGNVLTATHMVNGAENGLETREYYYRRAIALGNELMTPVHPNDPNWSDVMTKEQLADFVDERVINHDRALMRGNDALHQKHPLVYGKEGNGVGDRLHKLEGKK